MGLYTTTECAFPLDDEWADLTQHLFQRAGLAVLMAKRPARGELEAFVRSTLDTVRLGMPKHKLISLEPLDQPTRGSFLLRHTFETEGPQLEIALFFPVGPDHWIFRVGGDPSLSEACDLVLATFLDTFSLEEAT